MLLAFGTRARAFASWSSLVLAAGLVVACDKPAAGPPSPDASASASASAPAPIAKPREPRTGEYDQPRRVLARMQGNLERVVDGKEPVKLPAGVEAHPFEALVGAYKAVLDGDASAADKLAAVAKEAQSKLDALVGGSNDAKPKDGSNADYVRRVGAIAAAKAEGPEGTMIRLVATMRLVDAALVLANGEDFQNADYNLFKRYEGVVLRETDRFRDGDWLRLPCRTILGRRALVEAAAKRLEKAAGPVLGCPTPKGRELDFDLMERFAKDPAGTVADVLPKKPEPPKETPAAADPAVPAEPWDRGDAIVFMGEKPDAAEKPLEAASKKDAVGKLDYALFLHAFRPQSAARDAKIKKLLGEVEKASRAAAKKNQDEVVLEDSSIDLRAYDGTDESLLGILRVASSTEAANTTSAFYAIPCAVLLARPKILEATTPLFGGNRDNFLPRSGCAWGRGFVRGFPDRELAAYTEATVEADGNFYVNHGGTMRFALAAALKQREETMRVAPKEFLDKPEPAMAPYETWSYMTPESRVIFGRLSHLAEALEKKLVAHYQTRGLDEKQAKHAAHVGLFEVVWGASCGDAPPPRSLRKLVADGAPAAEIRAFIEKGEHKDAARLAPFDKCAANTGRDPLLHMAVLDPAALPVLLEISAEPGKEKELDLEVDPNERNDFGKTPLMAAAQQDRVESARILLQRGALVDDTTFRWGSFRIAHDARTALMYAAARGSLPMIRLLLDAGADKYAADTKGLRAVDYLVGHGPVPANSVLSPAELAEAVKLLF
ncbi:ankyrin repeat domain-containing protein [Polyangium jinanense]|uniref:Ankyrin repeat domain-containing protein n=1 Tax=Polyangium jinanense TaxID=2829994 RepID=A0A9X4AQQ4_9BACT|nr:ankyrin repeat domain-containing protein [Polyangium jinanense]MDC3954896.1 ankyrin repeat domain-containing protein [Polyangium jinanense]MDC3981334.1 ankyrin repeat domain-containing protein [Polyangium jinanense]